MTLEIPILAWHRHNICGGVKSRSWLDTGTKYVAELKRLMDFRRQYTYKQLIKKKKHAQIASTQKDHMEGLLRKN